MTHETLETTGKEAKMRYNPLYYIVFGLIALLMGWMLMGIFLAA